MNAHSDAASGAASKLIEGHAQVVAVDGDHVWLATLAPAACGNCATKAACGSGSAAPTRRATWCAPRMLPTGGLPLALGDTVLVGVDRGALTLAAWVAYGLPLLAMLAATLPMQAASDGAAAAAAVLGLLLGAALARVLVQRWQAGLRPVVLGRAQGHGCVPAADPGRTPAHLPAQVPAHKPTAVPLSQVQRLHASRSRRP